jgi:anti-repressor protein
MSEVVPFVFDGRPIGVVSVDGEPWFVGKDVAAALGYADPKKAIRQHCKALKKFNMGVLAQLNILNPPPSGLLMIPERDLYRLIMRSNLPSAERFEEWVVGTVLPAVRKTGSYNAPDAMKMLNDPATLRQLLLNYDEKIAELQQNVEEMTPKAEFYDRYGDETETYNLRHAARILSDHPNKVLNVLRVRKFLFYEGGRQVPYAQWLKRELFIMKIIEDTNGNLRSETHMTPKGLAFFHRYLSPEFDPLLRA